MDKCCLRKKIGVDCSRCHYKMSCPGSYLTNPGKIMVINPHDRYGRFHPGRKKTNPDKRKTKSQWQPRAIYSRSKISPNKRYTLWRVSLYSGTATVERSYMGHYILQRDMWDWIKKDPHMVIFPERTWPKEYEVKFPTAKGWKKTNPCFSKENPSKNKAAKCFKRLFGVTPTKKELKDFAPAYKKHLTFHGVEPQNVIEVSVPGGTNKFVVGIGEIDELNYTVPWKSERGNTLWKHRGGDHGGKKQTPPGFIVADPKTNRPILADGDGGKMFFKSTHGLIG